MIRQLLAEASCWPWVGALFSGFSSPGPPLRPFAAYSELHDRSETVIEMNGAVLVFAWSSGSARCSCLDWFPRCRLRDAILTSRCAKQVKGPGHGASSCATVSLCGGCAVFTLPVHAGLFIAASCFAPSASGLAYRPRKFERAPSASRGTLHRPPIRSVLFSPTAGASQVDSWDWRRRGD